MDRERSQALKGVAILFMLFWHLFCKADYLQGCECIMVGDIPLVYFLAKATNPVGLFLVLGGYGMYKVSIRGDRNRWARLLKLFIHYWVTLLIFVSLGHFIDSTRYPGTWIDVAKNVTAVSTTWNGEMWFLLPYAIVSASSPWLFRYAAKIKAIPLIIALVALYIPSYLIDRYLGYPVLRTFNLIFVTAKMVPLFMLGALAARERWYERIGAYLKGKRMATTAIWCVLVASMAATCMSDIVRICNINPFIVISCLALVPIAQPIKVVLVKLGNQSMNMWMIHSWFCYHLFREETYSLRYPIVIFVALVAVSYVCSLIVNRITLPIERPLMSMAVIKEKPIL